MLPGQVEQDLDPRIMPAFRQPQLLHAFRVMAQQRLHGMHAVDLFQLTHFLTLLVGALGLGGPLRCFEGLLATLAFAALAFFFGGLASPLT
ncbi:hypothetical protein D3C81_2103840 [compost metagenome]